jgi:hypothetical protein
LVFALRGMRSVMGEQAAIHRESGFAGCALNPQPEGWGTSLFMIVSAGVGICLRSMTAGREVASRGRRGAMPDINSPRRTVNWAATPWRKSWAGGGLSTNLNASNSQGGRHRRQRIGGHRVILPALEP